MATVELIREPLMLNDEAGLRRQVAEKAAELLGYSVLSEKLEVPSKPLASILAKLGIEPFTVESVKAYKDERKKEKQAQLDNEFRADLQHMLDSREYGWVSHQSCWWNETPIEKYAEPIPEFALSKAIEIKEACPDVQIFVDGLSVKRSDPFLVVKLGEESYHVEVWDEPKFEASL
jgi:hypothetical protein